MAIQFPSFPPLGDGFAARAKGFLTVQVALNPAEIGRYVAEVIAVLDNESGLSNEEKLEAAINQVIALLDEVIVFGGPFGRTLERFDQWVLRLLAQAIIEAAIGGDRRAAKQAERAVRRAQARARKAEKALAGTQKEGDSGDSGESEAEEPASEG